MVRMHATAHTAVPPVCRLVQFAQPAMELILIPMLGIVADWRGLVTFARTWTGTSVESAQIMLFNFTGNTIGFHSVASLGVIVHHATFTFLPSNVDLKYAAALCNNAACSARHRPIKYLLQRKHRRPRTRSVLWQWSTFNASRFGGRPHNAHFPFCAFSIHTYCRWVIPYFRRRYASFFLVRSDSFNEVSALKS